MSTGKERKLRTVAPTPVKDDRRFVIPWVKCDMCDDYVCNVHGNQHVHDCDCPPLEDWLDVNLSPYDLCFWPHIKKLMKSSHAPG